MLWQARRGFISGRSALQGAGAAGVNAAAFLARTSGLDATHQNAYIDLINGLDTDGLFAKLDVLHIYATADTTTAQLNLISSSYPATLNGSPTFTADRGYTGSASPTKNIDTGFNPSTAGGVHILNSGHLSYWNLTNTQTGTNIGVNVGGNSDLVTGSYIDNFFYARINSADGIAGNVSNTNTTGHFIGSRTASNVVAGYRNGSSLALNSNQASTALPNGNIYTIGSNDTGSNGVPLQYAMSSIGAGLTSTEAGNFYTRLRTYMTAVGVP